MKYEGRMLIGSNQAGKGDRFRAVDQKKYDKSWDKIFGDNRKQEFKECDGCGEKVEIRDVKYILYIHKQKFYYCEHEDCIKKYKQRRGRVTKR